RQHALKSQINLSRARAGQGQNFSIRPHRHKPAAAYGHSLGLRLDLIQRPESSVIQNGFRLLGSQERQRQKAAHTLHEIPSREWSHYSTSKRVQAIRVSNECRQSIMAQSWSL